MSRSLIVAVLALPLLIGGCSSVANDHSPAPNDYGAHFSGVQSDKFSKSFNTLSYMFLATNSDYPPYDTVGDQLSRDFMTTLKTLDRTLMNTDWDDPYID